MNLNSKIFIAGHRGMVGSAIHRQLLKLGYSNFVFRNSKELDLTNQLETDRFFEQEKPEYIFLAAAKVGGIVANNTYRAQFIYENLMIQNNVIHSAYKHNAKKLLFLGSSCIYPKNASQPMTENALLTGVLEPTNEPYAIAKIAGIKMCESYFRQYQSDFISIMPTNLYGDNDNYDLEKSHVLPALLRKMHLGKMLFYNQWLQIQQDLTKNPIENITGDHTQIEIKEILQKYGITEKSVTLWGTGNIFREFLHVDDMAAASIHIMKTISAHQLYNELSESHINIGTGIDMTIKELAEFIQDFIGYPGSLLWDHTKPDGTYKKLLDVTLLNKIGFKPTIDLSKGLETVYRNYICYQ